MDAGYPAGSRAKGAQAAMLGSSFVATQDAKVLTLKITSNGRLFTAAYNLDGSDSKIVSPTPGQPDEVIISHATWEGDRLVIKTVTTETQDGKSYQMANPACDVDRFAGRAVVGAERDAG
jgi:NAD(P)H-dependent flavin oxidoreductase YrpB (nitropropane dioxygenase family)